jgi:RarD protein
MGYMPDSRRGVLFGIAAYTMWGLFPLYWPLLKPSGAVEILAHRMTWSLVAVVVILAVRRHWSWFGDLIRRPAKLGLLALAAVVITVNWGVYIYAVNSDHVVESALGYFINPLVSVLFGVLLLGERLRPLQWAAVGFGVLAVVVLALDYGRLPWIALSLAVSFGVYGLIKKRADVGSAESLTIETLVLLVPALAYLVHLEVAGQATRSCWPGRASSPPCRCSASPPPPSGCRSRRSGCSSTSRPSCSSCAGCWSPRRPCRPAAGSASRSCGWPWRSSPTTASVRHAPPVPATQPERSTT